MKNDMTQMPLGQGGVPTVQDTGSFVLLLVTEGRPIVPFSPRSQDGVSSGREATVETLLALEIRCTELTLGSQECRTCHSSRDFFKFEQA